MLFKVPLYSIVFFAGLIASIIVAVIIWKRRPAPGAMPFACFVMAGAVWSFFWIFELSSIDLSAKIIWSKLEYLGIASSGVFWLFFTLDHAGYRWWRRPRCILLFSLIPAMTLLVIWTNEWHGWFWSHIYLTETAVGTTAVWEKGPWFLCFALYEYAIIAAGVVVLWRTVPRKSRTYLIQVITLTATALLPLMVNVAYLIKVSQLTTLDLTPMTMSISAISYAFLIFRYQLLDVGTVARNALIERIPDGILVLDAHNAVVDMNHETEQMLGLSKESARGRNLSSVWPEMARVISGAGPGNNDETALDISGRERFLDISLTPLEDRHGSVAGRLVMLRDVTDRHQMEMAILESENRYSTLVEQSNDGVFIIRDGQYKFANQTITYITGYPVEEFTRQALPFAFADEDAGMIVERYRQRLAGELVPSFYEIRMKRKDGKVIEVDASIAGIMYQGVGAHMVTIRDVTERRLALRKLESLYEEERQLRASLQQEIENRNKYTRALVHELKTPLTAILSSTELLELEISDGVMAAVVKNIRQASLNMEQRTNELTELARGEVGMLNLEIEAVDISELIRETVSRMLPQATAKGLTLKFDIGNLPLVLADQKRLRMILEKILSNSIKYTREGEVVVKARDFDEQRLLVQIKDTGCGIDQEKMAYLFDPYRRKMTGGQQYGGIGVGLALSRLYVELHHGKIWAESTPGLGTSFYFTLPVYKESKSTLNPSTSQTQMR